MERIKHQNLSVSDENAILNLPASSIDVHLPIFFGQCAEDYIVLSMLRALANREGLDLTRHHYLEIGANHPVSTSSTYLLHVGLGMTGVLVDANADLLPLLQRARPHDKILNVAVTGNASINEIDFYISDHSELSSIKPDFIENFPHVKAGVVKKVTVPCFTVNGILESYFRDLAPLFLSIDVEGLDVEIVESMDLSEYRPYIVQVETNRDWDLTSYSRIVKSLESQQYIPVAQTDVNLIVVDAHRIGARVDRVANNTAVFVADDNVLKTLRLSEGALRAMIRNVKVLSLDVFDTILVRKCVAPTDVFGYVGCKLDVPSFSESRVRAEQQARRLKSGVRGSEVSHAEIYEQLAKINPSFATLNEVEVFAESVYLEVNPDIIRVIEIARQEERRVVALSDIYLSAERLSSLLRLNGVFLDHVYTSCDYREDDCGKYNGKLFEKVQQMEGCNPEDFLHIGDNVVSDVQNARNAGWHALHVRKADDMALGESETYRTLRKYYADHSSGSVLGVIAKEYLDASLKPSVVEKFGFEVGGPLLLGFAQFLINTAKANQIKHLVLLARDGVIVNKVLNLLNPEGISWEVAPASRRMTVFPRYAIGGWPAIEGLFDMKSMTINQFLSHLSLADVIEHDQDSRVVRSAAEIAELCHAGLLSQAEKELRAIRAYHSERVKDHVNGKKFAWVDVGWALSSIKALNELLGVDAGAFFVGSHSRAYQAENFHGYLFKQGAPEGVSNALMTAVEPIELLFSDASASNAYIIEAAAGMYIRQQEKLVHERVRDHFVIEVEKGVLNFVHKAKDLLEGLDVQQLRQYNQKALVGVLMAPSRCLYEALIHVPHDRVAGRSEWKTIGDYWCPVEFAGAAAFNSGERSELQTGAEKFSKSRSRVLDVMSWLILDNLKKLSPPLTEKAAQRFAKSAEKRKKRLFDV